MAPDIKISNSGEWVKEDIIPMLFKLMKEEKYKEKALCFLMNCYED